ncbi:DUF551 domain-containing protein [Klebsiella variicola]|nr:DUF551 domain-containing protein [Klebsiella variicola]HCB2062866.1 DUF551 domain-containing protein [Klebsiella pneumoniae]HDS9842882.1 DUF551 domain-containing protein [Klebsiella quasipneumoniae subsp. similipneumoniae]
MPGYVLLSVELQERRKADREPYGFTDGDRRGMIYEPQYADRLKEPLPVYRHAQQPVVPDDVLAALQKVARIRLDLNDFDGDRRGIADCLCDAEEALIEVVNRRAAMLAAAPQSPGGDHATVPGKWIPVSERMPESNGVYFGWDGKRVLEVYCFFGGFSANQFIHGEITHWMPLPAAPQEAINALIPLVSRNEREVK